MSTLNMNLLNEATLVATISSIGLILLMCSSAFDLAIRKSPNVMVMLIVPLGLLRHVIDGDVFQAFGAAVAVFSVAMVAWTRGLLGGADVKLMGAAALLVPLNMITTELFITTMAGGGLAMLVIAVRPYGARYASPAGRQSNILTRIWHIEAWRLSHGGNLPYVVAITIGAAASIWLSGGR
jgi:prepilin peptidase CpaA